MVDKEVAAHNQVVSHRYLVHYPDHPARTDDPHYADFNHFHNQHRATARCELGKRLGFDTCADAQGNPAVPVEGGAQPGLELHHSHVEFSLQNGVDLALLEKDYPGISDPSQVGAWVESADNLVWYCVLPDVPVLMGDGSEVPIQDVRAGASVLGHDGRPHTVTAVGSRAYTGGVVQMGPCAVTEDHKVFTDRGWLPAGQIGNEVRVMAAHVLSLRFDQFKIVNPVVGPDAVDMVDTFCGKKRSAKVLLHDEPMLHDGTPSGPYAQIALGRELGCLATRIPARECVQRFHPAGVRAMLPDSHLSAGAEKDPAHLADSVRCPSEQSGARLTSDSLRVGRKWLAAIDARSSVNHSATFYHGRVYDLAVEGSHSFFAGGIAVHNCAAHHRGAGGVHTAAASDWEAERYVRNLIGPAK
jgi:hypothetical protein